MTVKDLAEVAGVSKVTIIRKGKGLFPDRIKKGVKTDFTKDESCAILSLVKTTFNSNELQSRFDSLSEKEDYMTVADLMDVAGVSRNTILRVAKEYFPEKVEHGVLTTFNKADATTIIYNVHKNNVVLDSSCNTHIQSGRDLNKNRESASHIAEVDYAAFGKMMATIITGVLPDVISKLPTKVPVLQLESDNTPIRNRITYLVRSYAHKNFMSYHDVWLQLYRDFMEAFNFNVYEVSKSSGMTIIDYLDAQGLISDLEEVAKVTLKIGDNN